MAGPNGIHVPRGTWVFTYWEAGDKAAQVSQLHPDWKVFGSRRRGVRKTGRVAARTNELNKDYVGETNGCGCVGAAGRPVDQIPHPSRFAWLALPQLPPQHHANETAPPPSGRICHEWRERMLRNAEKRERDSRAVKRWALNTVEVLNMNNRTTVGSVNNS